MVISSPDVSKELCDDESRVGTIKKPSLRLFISSLLIITSMDACENGKNG